jgi:hypothetical protein
MLWHGCSIGQALLRRLRCMSKACTNTPQGFTAIATTIVRNSSPESKTNNPGMRRRTCQCNTPTPLQKSPNHRTRLTAHTSTPHRTRSHRGTHSVSNLLKGQQAAQRRRDAAGELVAVQVQLPTEHTNSPPISRQLTLLALTANQPRYHIPSLPAVSIHDTAHSHEYVPGAR